MKRVPKLIILRGPSGSGKTTVAKKLFEKVKAPTVLIEQDYYRFIFKPAGGTQNSQTIHEMIKANILSALNDSYDVITEGIYNVKSYKETFAEIFKAHPKQNYIFYFDISFEETLKRHDTKPNKDEWTKEDMREWYKHKDFLGYDFEYAISEDSTLEKTIKFIKQKTGI